MAAHSATVAGQTSLEGSCMTLLRVRCPSSEIHGSGNTPYWTQTGQRNRHGFPSFSPRIVTGPLDQDPRGAGPSGLQPGAHAQAQRGWSGDPNRPDGSSASRLLQCCSSQELSKEPPSLNAVLSDWCLGYGLNLFKKQNYQNVVSN